MVTLVTLCLGCYLSFLFMSDANLQYVLVKHANDHNAAQMAEKAAAHLADPTVQDEDGDGSVDAGEFKDILRAHSADGFSHEAFQAADEDKDGKLSAVEFAQGMHHAAKASGSALQQKYLGESKKRMCQVGAYHPLYLETKGDGWFAMVAAVINLVQFVVWFVSSMAFLVMCPVHTLYGALIMALFVLLGAVVVMACTVVFSGVRRMMGKPTELFFGITMAQFCSGVVALAGIAVSFYLLTQFYVWLIPEEYVAVFKAGGGTGPAAQTEL